MPQFDGHYTRASGAQRDYDYTVTYGVRGNVLSWMAAVRSGGVDKGHPGGEWQYPLPPSEDEQRERAELLARSAVEALDGVAE